MGNILPIYSGIGDGLMMANAHYLQGTTQCPYLQGRHNHGTNA